ncbi:MAG TPA: hypothetical protein VMS11_02670 [Solirubrobacterales bacterium]|nr:hypothetical protein [Solirubrobacterales bacterium]
MSLDLGSPVLDVAFGLSFVFFLLSVVSSALGEGVAWATKQRSKMLEKGLVGMLGDDEVAEKIFDHPLVQTDVKPKAAAGDRAGTGKTKKRRRPSYLSPRNFALALTQTLKEVEVGAEGVVHYGAGAVKQIDDSFAKLDPNLRHQLEPLWHEANKDLDQFRARAEKWFDDQMDRVSGWYKRWSQVVTIVVALVVAVGLNASALRVTERLYNDEAVRSAVVTGAEGAAQQGGEPETTGKAAETAVGNLETLKLPIFWADDNLPWNSWQAFGECLLGWLITAVAISLGAPFWFDALGKISKLRTSGAKPQQ